MRKNAILAALLAALLLGAAGCTEKEPAGAADIPVSSSQPAVSSADTQPEAEDNTIFAGSGIASMALGSADLHDGVWDTVITDTKGGSNLSPQLSWEPVEGADSYVIFMVDTDATNWMHWKSEGVAETELPRGWASEDEYIGPYPPSGTHDYEVYVIALAGPVERVKGSFNSMNLKFAANTLALDTAADGSEGNILAYGHITGTYTHGD